MNRIYRLIWNDAQNTWVPVAELTSARGKRNRAGRAAATFALLLASSGALAAEPPPSTLPTGGQVIRGNAALNQSGARLDINQTSERAVIDWQRFDIGRDATVNFAQPSASSVTLNRVLSADPSAIFGKLNANGQVFLSNPNGVLFGSSARVDVGGLAATSMQINPDDVMAGSARFEHGGGAVINQGTLTAKAGGYLALMAPEVRNEGVLSARLGTVAMAAGEAVTLDLQGTHLLSVQVDPAAVDVLVENRHLIVAEDGQVILSASAAQRLVDGAIAGASGASGLVVENGEVRLINLEGTVRAANVAIDGGSTGLTRVAGTIEARTSSNNGGHVLVTGDKVHLDTSASIDASGNDGGTVLIGGDQEGKNPNVRNAQRLFIDANAAIHADGGADADGVGNAGRVIAYSTQSSRVYGELTARGGAAGGNGGFIETSGGWLDVGSVPDASAVAGHAGQWLIDPMDITIQSGGTNTGVSSGPNWQSTADNSVLSTESIVSALNAGTAVTVTTGNGGSGSGNISVSSDIIKSAGNDTSLSLRAHASVFLNAQIGSTSGELNVTVNADSDANGTGRIGVGSSGAIRSRGGDILLRGGLPSAGLTAISEPYTSSAFLAELGTTAAQSNNSSAAIELLSATLDAAGGNIELRGLNTNNGAGINLNNTTLATTGAGTIKLYGATGVSGFSLNGVRIGASTSVSTEAGNITIYGMGRASSNSNGILMESSGTIASIDGNVSLRGLSTGAFLNNQGVSLANFSTIRTTGTGYISMSGQGGGANGNGVGINIAGSSSVVTEGSGAIQLSGSGASSGTTGNEGVRIDDATVEVQGAGNTELRVEGAGGTGTGDAVGVSVRNGGVLRSAAGDGGLLYVRGIGGGDAGSSGNMGILVDEGVIQATGGAATVLLGYGGQGSDSVGMKVTGSNNLIGSASTTGDITFNVDSIDLGPFLSVRSTGSVFITPRTVGIGIGVGDGATGLLNLTGVELSRFHTDIELLTIGASNGTGAIDVGLAILNTATLLQTPGAGSAGIYIHGALDADTYALNLTSDGGVTQAATGTITAGQLLLSGSGPFTLTNAGNSIATLAASIDGDLHFVNAGSFSVGEVDIATTSFAGIDSTSGSVTLEARGTDADLTLERSIISGAAGTAVQLSAGRNFINDAGVTAITTANGRWLAWAADPETSTPGGLAYDFKQYRANYGVTTPAQSEGNGVLFAVAPTIAVSLGNIIRNYDGTSLVEFRPGEVSLSGVVDGDNIEIEPFVGAFASKDAGYKTVTVSDLALGEITNGSAVVYGYELDSTGISTTGLILQGQLTITADDVTRAYGEVGPQFTVSYDGFIAGEDPSVLDGSLSFSTAAHPFAAPGEYEISPSGITAVNYMIAFAPGTLTITDAPDVPDVPEMPDVPDVPDVPEIPQIPDVPDVPNDPEVPTALPPPSPPAGRIEQLVAVPSVSQVTLVAADRTLVMREPTARSMIVNGGIASGVSSGMTVSQSTTVWGGFISAEPLSPLQVGGNSEVMYQLPQETFRHSDASADVRITAQAASGEGLPESLHFDPATGVLSGTLPADHPGLIVVFIAQDSTGGEASTRLELRGGQGV